MIVTVTAVTVMTVLQRSLRVVGRMAEIAARRIAAEFGSQELRALDTRSLEDMGVERYEAEEAAFAGRDPWARN